MAAGVGRHLHAGNRLLGIESDISYFNADTGLCMVRTDHEAFYRRVLLAETISEPRPFPGWATRQVILMASDFPKVREKILTRFPIMRSNAFERRMLFDRVNQRKTLSRPSLVPAQINTAAS